jgi:hypothetical protein
VITIEVVAWVLAAAMLVGGTLNLAAPESVREEFARWGYPPALRIGVALAEYLAAVLLFYPPTRVWGAALALAVLAGVLVTLGAREKAFLRCEYPAVLAVLALLVLAHA